MIEAMFGLIFPMFLAVLLPFLILLGADIFISFRESLQ
jgi:hypothetical protein